MPARSASIADASRGRAEEHRVDQTRPRLFGRAAARSRAYESATLVADERAQDRLVVLGEDLGERPVLGSSALNGTNVASRAGSRPAHRDDAGESRRRIAAMTRSGSAPARSTLLTKIRVGTWSRWRARNRSGVCGWTPSTAETTRTAPSSTPRTRSTSAMKSGWPGVSTRLTARSPTRNEATADRIVMPRSRSRSSESVWVVPASTLPTWSMAPAVKRSRSVRVVLPASTCARMPRLSVRMGASCRARRWYLLAGHGCSHLAPFSHRSRLTRTGSHAESTHAC